MTKLLRFTDLKARGIITSWAALKIAVDKRNFPPGRMAGPKTRVWTEAEVDDWVASLPSALDAKPKLRGGALMNAEAKRRREHAEKAKVSGDVE